MTEADVAETQWEPGKTAYSRDGQKHYVREVLPNGRLLASQYLVVDGWDGEAEEYVADTASILIASEMFAEAPVASVNAEVVAARVELDALRSTIRDTQAAARDVEREYQAVADRIAKAPKFSRLRDYIDGKITHVVCSDYQHAAVIKPWAEFAAYREDRNIREQGIKLLTLFGDTGGNTEWRLNTYRDGSGSWTKCQPCTSEEEAIAVAGEWIDAAWLTFTPERPWFVKGAINSADEFGLPVPAHIREANDRHEAETHERTIAKMKSDLAAAEERYAEARASFVPSVPA